MASDIVSFSDQLKVEGVNCKGFGILPKYVMLDSDLTIEAKTIYAYFCSYAGNGNSAFPSRSKIIDDLQMSKATYYKHYRLITEQGYITVKQEIGDRACFGKNIYTLVSNPKKFEDNPQDSSNNLVYSRIRFSGLKAAGYGMIPRAVMIDDRLPVKAKGIYAYFCSYTGSGNSAFPQKDRIIYHLQITEDTYYKYYKLLIGLNYITAVQRHIGGRLSVNDYYLNDTPDLAKASKKAGNAKTSREQPTSKRAKSTRSLSPEKQKSNFDLEKTVGEEILSAKMLPLSFKSDLNRITAAIHFITEWHIYYPNGYQDQAEQQVYNLFNEALIQMCATPRMKINGSTVTNEQVFEHINRCAEFGKSYMSIAPITDSSMEHFATASSMQEIRNPLLYMQSCIWSALLAGGVSSCML